MYLKTILAISFGLRINSFLYKYEFVNFVISKFTVTVCYSKKIKNAVLTSVFINS